MRPSVKSVWTWLEDVPDPEIPVISIVDLGIVRDVSWVEGVLHVTLTPTYSGCPATSVITLDVQTHLLKQGVSDIKIVTQIAPPWTTQWISQEGREKLKAYGIVPPDESASCSGMLRSMTDDRPTVCCPICSSENTKLISQFGSTPCKASYQCQSCSEPFDYFKAF